MDRSERERCVQGWEKGKKRATLACHSECLHNGIILIVYIHSFVEYHLQYFANGLIVLQNSSKLLCWFDMLYTAIYYYTTIVLLVL